MHDLVRAASVALSTNDAETLERLAADALVRCENTAPVDLAELTRAAHVLAAQVQAAALHLDLRSRGSGRPFTEWKANPWDL